MKCWFCGKEEGEPSKAYQIEMYGDVVHAAKDAEEAVSFNKKLIVVARCADCRSRQRIAKAAGGFALFFLAATVACAVAILLKMAEGLYLGIAAGFFFGMVIEFLTIRYFTLKGTQTEARAKRRNEEVVKYRSKGYEFGRAPIQFKVKESISEED